MKNILKSTLVVFIIFITVSSCKKKDEPVPPIVYDTAELVTRNYLTSASGFDWLVNGNKNSTDLRYAFGSKGPFQWNADSIAAVILSINDADTGTEVFSTTLTVEKDKSYYSGLVGSSTSGTVVFINNDPTPPATGNVRIRFLQAYQDIGAVDISIGGITADHKKVTNLEFAEMSAYIEVSLADASTMIVCTNTGVAPDEATNLLTIGANTSHEAGKIYEEALSSLTTDPISKFTLFVTEQ
ncbi:MAG: hypothetical protein DRI71_08350 [Bacteroidetes bacterium]|nr:MAG: hypothetical protein DRI71_08350 [Bacteroidota bacterium]